MSIIRLGQLTYDEQSDSVINCETSTVNENKEMSKVSEMEMAYGEYLND